MNRDYRRLVSTSAGAALLAVACKASGVVTVANLQGAALRPRFAFGWFPYLEIGADPATFATVVTLSTAGMAAVAALRLLPPALRGDPDRDLVTGRLLGVVIAAETFALECVRHLVDGSVVAWPAAGATLSALGVGLVAAVVAVRRSGRPGRAGRPAQAAGRPASPMAPPPPPPRQRAGVPTAMLSLPPDPFAWDRREPAAGIDDEHSLSTVTGD